MSLFAWDPKYSVGHPDIDEQHKQLFKMAEDLHMAMLEGRGKEALGGLFSRLVTYTRHHFANEERIMRENAYPGYVQHHLEHEKLTQQVLDMQKRVATGKATVTMELMQFLSDWLRNHIQVNDQKVSAHIRKRPGVLTRA
jgi:hemerythrin-like metal-binding protein